MATQEIKTAGRRNVDCLPIYNPLNEMTYWLISEPRNKGQRSGRPLFEVTSSMKKENG